MRRYYSSRKRPGNLSLDELYGKLQGLYLLFRDKDYLKEKAGITKSQFPDAIQYEASIALTFQPFPITKWSSEEITEDHVFDTLEFLYDYVSKPFGWGLTSTETGYTYYDYNGYDEESGRAEFREKANAFLADYKSGYELTADGVVVELGTGGLQHILNAEITPYDEVHVDSKVRHAIGVWRKRRASVHDKKAAIRELADVFEWLKKARNLSTVLDRKDEAAIFEIANNFGIRHHDPRQKTNYDPGIWYSWIFHFYLATYHAAVRLLIKHEKTKRS